jgi:multidrug resistance efflux pump
MSQVFDALTQAQDEAVQRLNSLSSAVKEAADDTSSAWQRPRDSDFFNRVNHYAARLPGKVALSHQQVRNYLLLAFFVVGLVLVGTNIAFRPDGYALANSPPIYGVPFPGTVHPATEIRITNELTGTVSDISVKVGDRVRKGQQLLRMDQHEAELTLKQANLELRSAAANLDKFRLQLAEANARVAISQRQEQQVPTRQWRDSPERAAAAYEHASTNYSRAKKLYELGVLAQQELDARATELRIAQDDLENAKKLAGASAKLDREQADQVSLQSRVTRAELQEQLHQAELKYQRAKQQADGTIVRATQAGVVSEIAVRLGDRVSEGTILVRLAELDRMVAEVPVAATMISGLKVGQPARVALPSSPPREVEGRIRVINPLPSANMTHSVEVEFENPTLLLLAGQPAEIRFVKP